jgi:hypothetical protein
LPGSFNPLHAGHVALAETAAALTGFPAAFELTIVNADKPPLPAEEVRRRLTQFTWKAPLWLTRAPTFAAKAELFPGAVFVVGADTAERIVQPRFYGGSDGELDRAMNGLCERGCRFLVAGRMNAEGKFADLDSLNIAIFSRPSPPTVSASISHPHSCDVKRSRADCPRRLLRCAACAARTEWLAVKDNFQSAEAFAVENARGSFYPFHRLRGGVAFSRAGNCADHPQPPCPCRLLHLCRRRIRAEMGRAAVIYLVNLRMRHP